MNSSSFLGVANTASSSCYLVRSRGVSDVPASTSLRRSILGIPANESRPIGEYGNGRVDILLFDLEDSLPAKEKEPARIELRESIIEFDAEDTKIWYRINGVDTRWWYGDIIEIVETVGDQIDTVVVPKVRTARDLHAVDRLLDAVESSTGLQHKAINIGAQIETAEGMTNITEIVRATDRLSAVIFGPADYAASVGASHGSAEYPGHYWHYPLSRISHAASGVGVSAIGGPYTSSSDTDGFRRACHLERDLGYEGKVVITPEQAEIANDMFSPNPEEIQRAQEIVQEYDRTGDDGVAALNGNVIDREMYVMANRIVSRAKKAGLL